MGAGSGVATGWHGWTMSRGPAPELKEPPREKQIKKKMKKWKKKRKGRTKLFKYPDGAPHESKQMTENTKIKHWLSSHNLLNMKRTMGNWGPMYSFSACMSSKFSQLKFGPVSLKECNGAVLNRLKIIRGLEPPISPSCHQGAQFSIARVSNLGPRMSSLRYWVQVPFVQRPHVYISHRFSAQPSKATY